IALAFDLFRPQVGQKTEPVDQVHAEERDRLPYPVAELAAGEVDIVENGVESRRMRVVDAAIAGRPQKRGAKAGPIAIVGKLDGAHLGVDVLRLVGERIQTVTAERPIEGVSDVISANVAITGPAEIGDIEPVGLKDADRGGPHEKIVLVVMKRRL